MESLQKCDIDAIENVQHTFTRRVFNICSPPPAPYDEHLAYLGLQLPELRLLHTDLIRMYKIIH